MEAFQLGSISKDANWEGTNKRNIWALVCEDQGYEKAR